MKLILDNSFAFSYVDIMRFLEVKKNNNYSL